uniref:mRNA-degrading endonuclease RelE, toxin component of the RelBE toxin-antitoxin system n=1 Tax=Candidatus Kentrum sp. DK TaxID=2126562 RepID=A0A450SVL3_9GAMM|nr:MAG: mRNA-degrading endonuclease RelE, toxin component of the RelBE toxin-antitoxin system [Candidatus Kentron sp. DK]
MFLVKNTRSFHKKIKKISRHYPNIVKDLLNIIDSLESGNFIGDAIPGFSRRVYKARVPSSDQKRGKRGGFRVIYYVVMDNKTVYLLTVYAKSRQQNIDPPLIQRLIEDLET